MLHLSKVFIYLLLSTSGIPDKEPKNQWLIALNALRATEQVCGKTIIEAAKPLEIDSFLTLAAKVHAADMANSKFTSHKGSDGSLPHDRVKRVTNSFSKIGEAIALTEEPVDALHLLMNSPRHCAILTDSDYTHVGMAVILSNKGQEIGVVFVIGKNKEEELGFRE